MKKSVASLKRKHTYFCLSESFSEKPSPHQKDRQIHQHNQIWCYSAGMAGGLSTVCGPGLTMTVAFLTLDATSGPAVVWFVMLAQA